MTVELKRGDISLLISLVSQEIDRVGGAKEETSTCSHLLVDIRNKLLVMLSRDANLPLNFSDEELPEFRQYARRKYRTELDEDLITMIEDLIDMRRQGVR